MEITITAEQEAQLSLLAAAEGKESGELAQDLLDRGLAEEARFLDAVKLGQQAARRGELLESAEVWANVERILQA